MGLEPARRVKWLRVPALRKLLKLDELEKAGLVLVVAPIALFKTSSEIRVIEEPKRIMGIVEKRDGGEYLYICYIRASKEEFHGTYKEILNSVRLVD